MYCFLKQSLNSSPTTILSLKPSNNLDNDYLCSAAGRIKLSLDTGSW